MKRDHVLKGARPLSSQNIFALLIKVVIATQCLLFAKVDGYRTGTFPNYTFGHPNTGHIQSRLPRITHDNESTNVLTPRNQEYYDSPANSLSSDEHILAMLCFDRYKYILMRGISKLLLDPHFTRRNALFLYKDDDSVAFAHNCLLERLDSDLKINRIDSKHAIICEDAFITIATHDAFLRCYTLCHGSLSSQLSPEMELLMKKYPKISFDKMECIYINGSRFEVPDDILIRTQLSRIMNIYLKDVKDLPRTKYDTTAEPTLDVEFLSPISSWINSVHVHWSTVAHNAASGNKDIVMLSDFSIKTNANKDLQCNVDTPLIPLLNKTCRFFGLTDAVYNPQHVRNWLKNVIGDTRIVSLRASPSFKVVNSLGESLLFDASLPTASKTLEKICYSKASVNPERVVEYVKKKSNAIASSPIHAKCNAMAAELITKALESVGIDTLNKLKHDSSIWSSIKGWDENKQFLEADGDKISIKTVIHNMVDLGSKRLCRNIVKRTRIESAIKSIESLSLESLIKYIKEQNVYPVVIYNFDTGIPKIAAQLESLLSNDSDITARVWTTNLDLDPLRSNLLAKSSAFIRGGDHTAYRKFVFNNIAHLKIVLTDDIIPGGKHYIFFSSNGSCDNSYDIVDMSNVDIYSYTSGANLVTFTFGLTSKIPSIAAGIYSPIYINLKNLKLPISEPRDEISKRGFCEYLKRCKEKFDQTYMGDILSRRRLEDKLEEYFKKHGLDVDRLTYIDKKLSYAKKKLTSGFNSAVYINHKRQDLIYGMYKSLDIVGNTILGCDHEKYTVKYFGNSPLDHINGIKEKDREKMAECKLDEAFLLESENGYYLITNARFVKDVLSFEKSPTDPITLQSYKYECGETILQEDKLFSKPLTFNIPYILINTKGKTHSMEPILECPIPSMETLTKYTELTKRLTEERDDMIRKISLLDSPSFLPEGYDLNSVLDLYRNLESHTNHGGLEEVLTRNQISETIWGKLYSENTDIDKSASTE
ncbi:hypothetical protein BEWA_030170 [Theileria equi strain WA]|uniref:Uncharacterized protein n=1 Tax=Theileria equi strain WA TaxID=1537102 RepID=L0AZ36_THEEQ|nr:hypothetical protein BEWA_030170 [Theileria equi strain WA]AFZ80164.1 hypothetical protein BEWA_030170 [Theileria equi strain WA]|eukprot:XP_004829830.1 hypothetical protein BEWA_030170 [Theileria equi strain WA]